MIGSANGARIGITGLGVYVPDRVFTNKDLEQFVDTTDEWIVERTGIRERRFATEEQERIAMRQNRLDLGLAQRQLHAESRSRRPLRPRCA